MPAIANLNYQNDHESIEQNEMDSLSDFELRAKELLIEHQQDLYKQTDHLFAVLLICEWAAGILAAIFISPLTWAGSSSSIHIHVWTAIFGGALIVALPVFLVRKLPGEPVTRYTISMAQMLYSALLIHLTGGRIETHFHVFGSLAFLSFYRDWKVLVPSTIVVALDHLIRGFVFPQSVYGVSAIEPWRWAEHSFWVLFEDAFLISMCLKSSKEMRLITRRQAELEQTNKEIEKQVCKQTQEIKEAKSWETMQLQVMKALAEAPSWTKAIKGILESLSAHVAEKSTGATWCAFWTMTEMQAQLSCVDFLESQPGVLDEFKTISKKTTFTYGSGLPGLVWRNKKALSMSDIAGDCNFLRNSKNSTTHHATAVAFPVFAGNRFFGVFEIVATDQCNWNLEALEALGRQIGHYLIRKEAESEKQRLANIVVQSSDAIITTSANNLITSWNNGSKNLFKYSTEEALSSPISILFSRDEDQQFLCSLEEALQSGEKVEANERVVTDRNGHQLDVILYATPWFNESGDYEGCSLTFHNITERKEAERRLFEFYSVVSHELRSPLTSIRGVLGLIESKTVEPDSEEALELIAAARSSSDRLIRLINDMLDLKKIEAGKMELHKSMIEVDELLGSAVSGLRGMAEEYGIRLVAKSVGDSSVYADWDKATQILTNLISNAIKFTPSGEEVLVLAQPSAENKTRFHIKDRGPGIAAKDMDKLFSKFKQLDSSNCANVGTGLGLAISKALVEQHGGLIGVNSTPGEGSEFWFELPSSADIELCSATATQTFCSF